MLELQLQVVTLAAAEPVSTRYICQVRMFTIAIVTQSLRLRLAPPSRHSKKHANIPSPHTQIQGLCLLHGANTYRLPKLSVRRQVPALLSHSSRGVHMPQPQP